MNRIRFIVSLIFLIAALPVLAQTPTTTVQAPVFPITAGRSLEGNINDNQFTTRYTFQGQVGESVTIRMNTTSGDLDPFLILFSPDGDLLEQNDDTGSGNRNAEITMTLDEAGEYVIEATRFQQASGPTSGTYSLRLDVEGAAPGTIDDPLTRPPTFGVPFEIIDYQDFVGDTLASNTSKQYFVVGGQQGDLIRATMSRTSGDIAPQVRIFNNVFASTSQEAQASPVETIVYATLPATGWYLIEASARSGSGSFSLYVDRRTVAVIELGQTLVGEFLPGTDTISYVINAHIGDQVIATVLESEFGSGFHPELRLLDLSLRNIALSRPFDDTTTRVRAYVPRTMIPRSGTYILQLTNLRPDVGGKFELKLTGIPVNITKLSNEVAVLANYNELYKGALDDTNQVTYYRFAGKAGELVTIEMTSTSGGLDPYVILTDAQLDELAFNDNIGNTPTARITQFALPADGDYFILASHADLTSETQTGSFDLALTVGRISLVSGSVTVTVAWETNTDLNLFIRDPQGHTISWSNPTLPSGAIMQVDSNTRCQTPSAQPVEHVYWQPGTQPTPGEYQVWVWYQNVCTQPDPTTFSLQMIVDGELELDIQPNDFRLTPDERYEATFFVTDTGFFVTDAGRVTVTTPQQRASQGGDILIPYGESITGTVSNDVFALFYQFVGEQGDIVEVNVDAVTGNLDPYVVLRDSSDNNLASNDDADAATQNSHLTYTLPADGQYVIAVTRFGLRDGTTTGDFRLTLQQGN